MKEAPIPDPVEPLHFFKDVRRDQPFLFTGVRPGVALIGEHPLSGGPFVRVSKFTFRPVDQKDDKVYVALYMERIKFQ
jgi:hypothetical protein